MKKAISVLLCMILACSAVFSMAGCTKQDEIQSDIVLITDGGNINDGGYNQSAWEGISAFADDNALACRYYQPVLEDGEITTENVEKYVEISVDNGAKYIVLPGERFAVPAYEIASSYPDVKFILIDAIPHAEGENIDRFMANVMSVKFDALQSGILAGFIAVSNGNTELGYFGEYNSESSANYGAGFVQGAAIAADSLGVPVTVDWAEYDSPMSDYNFDFTVTANYKKIDDIKEKVYKINVVDGIGTGVYTEGSNVTVTANPAPAGMEFDHWEVKSDTKGVKDKKVNISSKNDSTMNLLVEKCDSTITAKYKKIEGNYYSVKIMSALDGNATASEQSVAENGQCEITAPIAPENMVFDHWECPIADAIDDANSKTTTVNVTNQDLKITPVYTESTAPTFNVSVVTGKGGDGESTGSGSYVAGDLVNVSAAVPADGYMFSHWENVDAYGHTTGIAMENEYYCNTSFEMTDRYAAICESMYNKGVTMIFNGGNSQADSAFTAKENFDYDLSVISAGANNKDAYTTITKNYGEAVKDCLENYMGGSVFAANCKNDGIGATFVTEDKEVQENYDKLYEALANREIKPIRAEGGAGSEFCRVFAESNASKCLTLNGWFYEVVIADE